MTVAFNVSPQAVESKTGLLTTVAYQLGKNKPAVYALEVRPISISSDIDYFFVVDQGLRQLSR